MSLVTRSQQRELDMEHENNFAEDLQQATTHIEEAFRLVIKYHKRDGKPLSYQERKRFKKFMGSIEALNMLDGLLDVPVAFRV
jgi:hypothetical protein